MASQTAISVERKAKALRDFLFGVPAVLGRLNADGTLNPNIADGLSGAYVWIRLQDNRAAIPAININVTNKIAGAGVLARLRPDSGWEVMQLDPNTASAQFGTAAGSANQPDRVQEWDTTGVEAYRLVPGRITASFEGGLFVWIEPFILDRKRWGGLHFLLTAPVSPGDRAFAVIVFDPAAEDNDDAFSQVWSEDVPANFVVSDIPTYQDAQDYINAATVADGLIILGGVLLGYGDTAVSVSQIVDVREWIDAPALITTTTTEDATETTLLSISVAEASAVRITGQVIGAKADYSAAAGRGFALTARRTVSGDVTLVGAAQYDAAIQEDSSGTPAISVDVDTSTQSARVHVTGIASEEWRWRVEYRVVRLTE